MASPTPKGNPGSRAMETALTSNSVDPDAWQQFLITQMTQISMPLARNMLENIGLNSSSTTPFTLLDHGCGLGIVAPVLMETVPPGVVEQSRVVCADLSETLVDTVKHRIEKERWVGCEAKVIDAENSGLPAGSFSHVVSNIMYHTVPDSQAALTDSIRLLQPGGTLAFTTWHSCNPAWQVYVRDAFATFPPALLPADFTFHMPMQTSPWGKWDDVDWVRGALSARLEDVHVEVFAHSWRVQNVEHFMKSFEKMIDIVSGMVLDAESVEKLGGLQGVRERTRMYLEERFEREGWTCVGVSICAWGRKSAAGKV